MVESSFQFKKVNFMRNLFVSSLIFFLVLISSCSTNTPPLVTVYSTSAAQAWLSELYDCAGQQNNVVLSRVDDSSSAEIALRVGEPKNLTSSAFQIDKEDILIV